MRAVAGGIAELLLLRKHSAPVGATAPTGAHGGQGAYATYAATARARK